MDRGRVPFTKQGDAINYRDELIETQRQAPGLSENYQLRTEELVAKVSVSIPISWSIRT